MSPTFSAMLNTHTHTHPPTNPARHAANDPQLPWSPRGTVDRQFIHMMDMFRPTGGLAPIAEVRHWLQDDKDLPGRSLDAWIRSRAVICIDWQSRRWLPWFQFNRKTLAPHTQLRCVLHALDQVHQPWEAACWFAQPNPWLGGRSPVHCLLSDLPGVLHAARADSVIANGMARSCG